MSTHNLRFCGKVRKIIFWIRLLSGAMIYKLELNNLHLIRLERLTTYFRPLLLCTRPTKV